MRRLTLVSLFCLIGAAGAQSPATVTPSAPQIEFSVPIGDKDVAAMLQDYGVTESRPARELITGWKPRKIVVRVDNNRERPAWFQKAVPAGVRILGAHNEAEALTEIADADALVGFCTEKLVNAGKALKWIHYGGVGVERCLLNPRVAGEQILLTNMQRVFGGTVSEHIIGFAFALTRGMDGATRMVAQGRWNPGAGLAPGRMWDLEGRTMLVVGMGGIGTAAARKAHALGMTVIATRNDRAKPDFVEYVGLPQELPDLIRRADIVVNTLPLTNETRGLFDSAMFARMKPEAYYISIGRGETTVTADLDAALRKGVIAGAGLDVTDPEPLNEGNPLWKAPNLLITPHMANTGAGTGQFGEPAFNVTRELIRRYAVGDRMFSVVDPKRGY